MRPREALVRWVTGLWRTTACSQAGMVSRPTKMLLANVSGIRNTKLVVITDSGVFTFMPKMIQIHESAKEKTSTSTNASSTPTRAAGGTEAEDQAEAR